MVNASAEPSAASLSIDALALQRGLARALECDPQTLRAAAERGLRPLAAPPSGPLTEPAFCFDPTLGSHGHD